MTSESSKSETTAISTVNVIFIVCSVSRYSLLDLNGNSQSHETSIVFSIAMLLEILCAHGILCVRITGEISLDLKIRKICLADYLI